MVKNLPEKQELKETWVGIDPLFDPWVGKFPWRGKWQPTPGFLPGESPWTEGVAGYRP